VPEVDVTRGGNLLAASVGVSEFLDVFKIDLSNDTLQPSTASQFSQATAPNSIDNISTPANSTPAKSPSLKSAEGVNSKEDEDDTPFDFNINSGHSSDTDAGGAMAMLAASAHDDCQKKLSLADGSTIDRMDVTDCVTVTVGEPTDVVSSPPCSEEETSKLCESVTFPPDVIPLSNSVIAIAQTPMDLVVVEPVGGVVVLDVDEEALENTGDGGSNDSGMDSCNSASSVDPLSVTYDSIVERLTRKSAELEEAMEIGEQTDPCSKEDAVHGIRHADLMNLLSTNNESSRLETGVSRDLEVSVCDISKQLVAVKSPEIGSHSRGGRLNALLHYKPYKQTGSSEDKQRRFARDLATVQEKLLNEGGYKTLVRTFTYLTFINLLIYICHFLYYVCMHVCSFTVVISFAFAIPIIWNCLSALSVSRYLYPHFVTLHLFQHLVPP